jgi:glycosyltransferase 2 family protein
LKKTAGYIARFMVSAGIILYIFRSPDISAGVIAGHIGQIAPVYLFLALAGFKACILISTLRWKLLMRSHNIDVRFSHALGLNYLGMFFNNFMLSITGGDVIKAYYASKLEHTKRAESAAIVFFDRLIGLAGLVLMGGAAALFGAGREEVASSLFIILAAFFCFFLMGFLAFNKKAARMAGRLVPIEKIRRPLKKVYEAVYYYRNDRRTLVHSLLLSVCLWVFMVFMNMALARGLGAEIPPGYFFIYIPIINIVSSIPVTIAGWGLREQMYVQFFGLVGLERTAAVSLSVSFALVLLLWSLIGGVLYALHWPMKKWKTT